jgi:hypothetical protein
MLLIVENQKANYYYYYYYYYYYNIFLNFKPFVARYTRKYTVVYKYFYLMQESSNNSNEVSHTSYVDSHMNQA